jgi:hypothetical protein
MVIPNDTPDTELPDVLPPEPPDGPDGRKPAWWRRLLARIARAAARGQRNADGGVIPFRGQRG